MTGPEVNDPQTSQWHLDKRVPVAMILTILFQTVAVVWWAASTEARVTHVEQALAKTENFGADMQTVQYRLNQIDIQADRIEDKIDRLSESKN